tara:strand:- start:30022 stop:31767 length:1746 start_codon:yes stop_codon:yes gene_type:complete
MSEYLVSARKYRPLNFDDVIGQQHITQTLSNAISNNQVAHAYLFCGPRGVGKTTCARIFSTLVNNNHQSEYNVFELDGASNNSVDDIRNLIEQVKIPPQIGKYKVYIIDEVHMLSKAAFNAFLKTLEEPPKHSIFILATTEKEKIIPTILSRCQIFDFKRISNTEIQKYLSQITIKENIKVENHTLQLIADKSDGSLRDALSIFDRIHTLCNTDWEHEKVSKILLCLDTKFCINLLDDIIAKDIPSTLMKINTILEKGFDSKEIIRSLMSHFRNLIIIKDSATTTLLIDEEKEILHEMKVQSEKLSTNHILLALNCLNECDNQYEKSINPRFLVELCIMQLCSLSDDIKKKLLIPVATQLVTQNTAKVTKTEPSKQEEIDLNTAKVTKTKPSKQEEIDLNTATEEQPSIIQINPNTESRTQNMKNNDHTKIAPNIESDLLSISEELESMTQILETKNGEEKNEWSEKQLIIQWKEFAKKLIDRQKINLANIFDRYNPKKDNNTLILELVSLSEKSEVEEIKVELLTFLKNRLKNDFIELVITLTQEDNKNMLHTKSEKYQHMLEKNQKIQLIKEQLDLNII